MRRPGENPVLYAVTGFVGRRMRHRHAGREHAVLTLAPAPDVIAVHSDSFADGAELPDVHAGAGRGPNRSPQLSWSGVPTATRQLLLVMEDVDVPASRPFFHMVAVLDPATTGLAEGALTRDAPGIRYLTRLTLGRPGYHGPRALPDHGPHEYDFALYALDEELAGDGGIRDRAGLVAYLRAHAIARGRISGTQVG
jgi:Raf kinase inhibitor-like YbhB/YbcL family protein